MLQKLVWAGGVCVALLLPAPTYAVPMQWSNGHYYEVIERSLDWESAQTAASAMSHMGFSGYLATMTSSGENSFVAGLLNGHNAWLGGNDFAIPDKWVWADGPESGEQFWQGLAGGSSVNGAYTNWGTNDPNNAGGAQYALLMCAQGVSPCINEGLGQWIDRQGSDQHYFVVEYGSHAVPEPSSMLLLGSGLAGLGAWRSRQRRFTPSS